MPPSSFAPASSRHWLTHVLSARQSGSFSHASVASQQLATRHDEQAGLSNEPSHVHTNASEPLSCGPASVASGSPESTGEVGAVASVPASTPGMVASVSGCASTEASTPELGFPDVEHAQMHAAHTVRRMAPVRTSPRMPDLTACALRLSPDCCVRAVLRV